MKQAVLIVVSCLLGVADTKVAVPAEDTCTDGANVMLQRHADDATRLAAEDGADSGPKKSCQRLHLTELNPTTVAWCDPKYNKNPPPKKLQGLFFQNILPEGETLMCFSIAPWNAQERTLTLDVSTIWLWNNCWRNFYIPVVAKMTGSQLIVQFEDDTLTRSIIKVKMTGRPWFTLFGLLNDVVNTAFNFLIQFPMYEESSFQLLGPEPREFPCESGECWSRPTYFMNGRLLYTYYPLRLFDGDMVMSTRAAEYTAVISNHTYRNAALQAGFPPPGPNIFSNFIFWFLGGFSQSECVNIVSPIHCVASWWAMFSGAADWVFGWPIWFWNWF